ncbi:DMT family transporter [Aestuariivirga sp.]|uniref:DMT family transporter n=1 Tax=Aestuariivirga sp. TaxID=2650926 RepID=UPI0025C7394F|nr:DMT family transporter [Aestuariivirga sp.]MCA3555235.1 DMT family transporter [Aestuariivirga sp.]
MALSQNLRGIAAIVVATGSFVANDTCMKLALADAPPFQVLVMRGTAAIVWCLPVICFMGLIRHLPKAFNPWVVLRSSSELVAILCFITALAHMPIADLTAITQTSPLVVLLGMWFLFGEKVGGLRLLLIGFGVTGALLVAQPGGVAASPFAVFGFLTAAGVAGRDILSRKVPPRTPALAVTFSTLLVVVLGALVLSLAFEEQVMPTLHHAWLMSIAGFFLMCGHSFVFLAYSRSAARVVAPFSYSVMIWAGLSGILVFGQFPNMLAIAGMTLIMASGLAIILLEGRRGRPVPAAAEL